MSVNRHPWDFARIPNYRLAPNVAVEEAEQLDARTFRRRYILENRPCLVKRAIVQWPAFQRWSDPEYVGSKIGDVEIQASCQPKIEAFGLRTREQDELALKRTQELLFATELIRELLPRLRTRDDEVLFIEVRPGDPRIRCLGNDLKFQGRRFPFLPYPPRPRLGLYSGWAVMFYKNSYSDWHFHPATDAMMCQVLGTKDVLLLPPTQLSWDQIVPIHTEEWKVYDVDLERSGSFRENRPFHVVVEPGDGLFLPVNWWHSVQARPQQYGITVPVTWDSPYRDLRQPATRHFLRLLWAQQKPLAAAALLATLYGTATNRLREQFETVQRT